MFTIRASRVASRLSAATLLSALALTTMTSTAAHADGLASRAPEPCATEQTALTTATDTLTAANTALLAAVADVKTAEDTYTASRTPAAKATADAAYAEYRRLQAEAEAFKPTVAARKADYVAGSTALTNGALADYRTASTHFNGLEATVRSSLSGYRAVLADTAATPEQVTAARDVYRAAVAERDAYRPIMATLLQTYRDGAAALTSGAKADYDTVLASLASLNAAARDQLAVYRQAAAVYTASATPANLAAVNTAKTARTQAYTDRGTAITARNTAKTALDDCLTPGPKLRVADFYSDPNDWGVGNVAGTLTITGLTPNTTYRVSPPDYCGGEDVFCSAAFQTDSAGALSGASGGYPTFPLGACGSNTARVTVYNADNSVAFRLTAPLPATVTGC